MIRLTLLLAAFNALSGPALAATPFDATASRTQIGILLDKSYPDLDAIYKDIHQHPELAFQETRTAALLAARMRTLGFTVTEHVGKTGIVAILKNGPGPTVLVRTELDALPLEEKTDLPYASHATQSVDGKVTPVDHACGHDSHMAWWLGTAQVLVAMRDRWHGTLMFVGQPAEEIISGAKAMLADGLFSRFPKPDYGFGAHVGPGPVGTIAVKQGVVSSASDTVYVTFHGLGAHGSMPDKSIDPIVEGAHFVNDVQTVVSRQKDPMAFGVITVGSFNSGTVANIIPDHADLQLTLRSFDPAVRAILNEGVKTTAAAVATMAKAPAPEVRHMYGTGSVVNDPVLAKLVAEMLSSAFGSKQVNLVPVTEPGGTASEDYSEYVAAGMTKSVLFSIAGQDPKVLADLKVRNKPAPVNHSPYFAPLPEPTIKTGVETLALAVMMVAR